MRASLPGLGLIYCQSRAYARFAYDEIFRKRQYSGHGIVLEPGAVVFDVGANIGLFSLFVDQECGGDVTLFVFEPIPETHGLLARNAERLRRAHLYDCGLTRLGGPKQATFRYYPGSSGLSTMKPTEIEALVNSTDPDTVIKTIRESNPGLFYLALPLYPIRRWMVRTVRARRLRGRELSCSLSTLSAIFSLHGIDRVDLLKVDVEGAELDVLEGLEESDWPKVQQLVVEVHDLDDRLGRMTRMLVGRGFEVHADVQEWSTDSVAATYMLFARRGRS